MENVEGCCLIYLFFCMEDEGEKYLHVFVRIV